MFLCKYRHISPCFVIILYMKPIGTTGRDFLSLSSELALEAARCVDIGKCRLKRTGIMCLWNAMELASLKSSHFDAWYTHPPDKLYCPPSLLGFFLMAELKCNLEVTWNFWRRGLFYMKGEKYNPQLLRRMWQRKVFTQAYVMLSCTLKQLPALI